MSAQDKKPFTREQQRKAKEYVMQRRETAGSAEKAVYAAALAAIRRLIHRVFMMKMPFSVLLTAALKSPEPLNADAPECAKLAEKAHKVLLAAAAGKREGAEKDTCEEMAEEEWEDAREAAEAYTEKLAREAEITALWAILNGKTENEAVKEWKRRRNALSRRQEQVGLHTDTESLPPYHKRCCCIAIPFTEGGL